MNSYPATIRITNLRLRTYVGFNPEERQKQQDVVINAEIRHTIGERVLNDEVEAALNYKTITKAMIQHIETRRFLLQEKLAGDLIEICISQAGVEQVVITVDKPHALRFADSVSITLEYDRNIHCITQGNNHEPDTCPFRACSRN